MGKKQHTLTQCAAIAVVQENTEMTVLVRVIAFPPSVSKTKRDYVKSKVFYSEVKGINNTSESELLYHKVVYGEKDAILTKDFYESIEGFSWQPYEDEYSYVPNVQFVCTKVSQITKLVKMANANDLSEELRTIVQTLANAIDWEREAPKRELNSYLVRGLVNFEKWLRCLLDDEDIDFDLEDFITDFFSTKKQNKFLGSTSTDKKPWQQLVKVAFRVNDRLIETKKIDREFFSLKRKKNRLNEKKIVLEGERLVYQVLQTKNYINTIILNEEDKEYFKKLNEKRFELLPRDVIKEYSIN